MNIELYYEEKGTGIPFVMLHGNGESHLYFRHQMEFFSKDYRVITPDTRGHGKSPRGEKEFSLKTFADDLYDFLKKKKIKKIILLGFSDGGNIALLFALKFPQMVKKLILNGANLFPCGIKKSFRLLIENEYNEALKAEDKEKESMFGLMVNEPDIDKNELKNIKIPTLVIAGTRDMISKKHTELIANSLAVSRLVFIKGDHFIANKRFAEFNNCVKNFLDEDFT